MKQITLGEVVRFRTGKLNSNAAVSGGKYPFFTCSQETYRIDKYSFDTECVLLAGNNAAGVYPLKYFKGKFDAYQRTYVIEPQDPEVLSTRFLYYSLRLQLEKLQSLSTGAATKFLTLTILKSSEISLPDREIQRRIASILSAYDDLIENNTRRIAILEEMARRIYEEWFVHFRFPGHEQVKMVESELGLIPEGVKKTRLGDLIEFKKGKKPLTISDSPAEGLLPHLLIDALRGGNKSEYAPIEKAVSVRDSDTIMVMDGSGSCDVFVGHTGVIGSTLGRYRAIDPKIRPYWLYLLFHVNQSEIKANNIGAAIPHANKDFINSMELFLPSLEIIHAFDEKIQPIFRLIKTLRRKNANLRTTRDLLLPKLISGELDVSTLPAPEEATAA